MFVPCFLFIFLGAPHIEQLRNNRPLRRPHRDHRRGRRGHRANLAGYFAGHTLFAVHRPVELGVLRLELPDPASLQPAAVAIAAVAGLLIFWRGWSVLRTLGVCAVLGLATAVIPLT